jgi:hypothetical protein
LHLREYEKDPGTQKQAKAQAEGKQKGMKAPEKMGAIEVDMQETSREPSQC